MFLIVRVTAHVSMNKNTVQVFKSTSDQGSSLWSLKTELQSRKHRRSCSKSLRKTQLHFYVLRLGLRLPAVWRHAGSLNTLTLICWECWGGINCVCRIWTSLIVTVLTHIFVLTLILYLMLRFSICLQFPKMYHFYCKCVKVNMFLKSSVLL